MASDVKQLPTGAINVDMLLQLVEGGGTYEVGKGVEVLGGFRYVDLNIDTRFAEGPTLKLGQNWVSPIGGVRFFTDRSKRVAFIGRADLGGYSTSKSSNFTWNLSALVNVRLNNWANLLAGYRALSVDYKTRLTPQSDFKFDTIMQGPMFALGIDFLSYNGSQMDVFARLPFRRICPGYKVGARNKARNNSGRLNSDPVSVTLVSDSRDDVQCASTMDSSSRHFSQAGEVS